MSQRTPSFRPMPGIRTSRTPAVWARLCSTTQAGMMTSARSGRRLSRAMRSATVRPDSMSLSVARSFTEISRAESRRYSRFASSPISSILPPVPMHRCTPCRPISWSSRRRVASAYSLTILLNDVRERPSAANFCSNRTVPIR